METLAFQQDLRPELPNVYGTKDYREFRSTLIKIDEILKKGDLETQLITKALTTNSSQSLDPTDHKNFHHRCKILQHALRCNIARHLTGESYRNFSLRLADSTLFQWFTHIDAFGSCKAISKSTLERYEKYFDESVVFNVIHQWLSGFATVEQTAAVGISAPIQFEDVFMDTTCIKAHIHFPVDWLLLRDAVRSLLSAIKTIRAQGLKHRMIDPSTLLKLMNQLCIKMTHSRRKKDSKKRRKEVLRAMKKLTKCILKHAERYRQLLLKDWQKTNWSEAQMQLVIRRIDNILEQLPEAIRQAHERIIGERIIKSSDKILSLYDKDVDVIVRGKAGSEVEFGQRLLLTEQQDGLIIDWKLFSKSAPSDSDLLQPTVTQLESDYGKPSSVSADRAFASAKNDKFLEDKSIFNATCPRSPQELQENLKDPLFVSLQTRRSQTEARIGIFKNVFLGKPLRSRITLNKRHAVNWCVLTHNLWLLSRKAIADELASLQEAA